MRRPVKNKTLMVRLRGQDMADVERAAKLETQRRGEIVGESTLLRELAMPRVREIVAAAAQAEVAA